MSDTNVATPAAQEPLQTPAQPDTNAQLAASMWDENFTAPAQQAAAPVQEPAPAAQPEPAKTEPENPKEIVIDANEWLKQNFGVDDVNTAKQEWEKLRQLQQQASTPAEIKFANDEAKRYYEAITAGKTDDLYNILHQQRQLSRLETLELTSANAAAEIIKANLQFKHKDLSPQEVERIFNRQYSMPPKPVQSLDQDDTEYAAILDQWKAQVSDKEQDMIIDAKLAKPELAKYKSELVLPEIPKVEPQQQGPSQEDLAKAEAWRKNFDEVLERDYNKFNGVSVTAKDGGIELPITYGITPEELTAVKQQVQQFNINEYFDKRWFDDKGNPNVPLIEKDLYVLDNLDKILQKVANEASAKRYEHELKQRNNINLQGVNAGVQQNGAAPKSELEQLAAAVWQ